ncbi:glycoside hydrolase family 16 protein, partial [Suhomyces tanzawaensis NRRL Y-17324]
ISCNSTNPCPESAPCCSQYGICGTGNLCANGCIIKNSYNLTSCLPMPRMGSFETQFDSLDKLQVSIDYLGNSSAVDWLYSGWVDIHDDALLMEMPQYSGGSVVSSTKYLLYGKVSATIKSSHLQGVITSFITYSDLEDEIDFEFVGYDTTQVQTNYYSQGALDYTKGHNSSTSDTMANWHTYTIDWQEDKIDWYIDGDKIRTLDKASTHNSTDNTYAFPQTPSRIQMSLWPGGNATSPIGTRAWAGGEIDWDSKDIQDNGYYYAYLKNVTVEAYDLPSGIGRDTSGGNSSKFDTYVVNSTHGTQSNIMISNRETILGDEDGTGFDRKLDKLQSSSASASSSASSSGSRSSSGSASTTASRSGASGSSTQSGARTTSTNTSSANGDFAQNSASASGSSSN